MRWIGSDAMEEDLGLYNISFKSGGFYDLFGSIGFGYLVVG
jgi:hypothetical protein